MGTPVYTTTQTPDPFGSYNPDAPETNWYCTTADVYDVIMGIDLSVISQALASGAFPSSYGITTVDQFISQRIIPKTESEIEAYCGQSFRPTQQTRFFDGNDSPYMLLPFYPIISLDACQLNLIPSMPWYKFQRPRFVQSLGEEDSTEYFDADLLVDPEIGKLTIPARTLFADSPALPLWNYTFIGGDQNVQVTWTYGFADSTDVPQSFRQAVALRAGARIVKLIGMVQGQGATEITIGNSVRRFGREKDQPYGQLIADMEAQSKSLLLPWRRVSI